MDRDQGIGALILVGSVAGIGVYTGLVIFYTTIMLQLTAFVAVASILGILAWIGWTMATTPPPAPIETEPISDSSITAGTTATATTIDPAEKQE